MDWLDRRNFGRELSGKNVRRIDCFAERNFAESIEFKMRVLIFDCLQLKTEKIIPLISGKGFQILKASTEDVGEHLWFGQFNAILVGGNIEQDFKQKVFELAESKNTKIIEIKNDNEAIETYVKEVILPELRTINKNEFTGRTRNNL